LVKPIAPEGVHEFVEAAALRQYVRPGMKAVDLGTGRGAMAERLLQLGCEVLGVDLTSKDFEAKTAHCVMDLNEVDFASELGLHKYDLVTAIEVIEHVENPIGFLRNTAGLLSPTGAAILTTPNVDSLPARLRHLFAGKLRMMDEKSDRVTFHQISLTCCEGSFYLERGSVWWNTECFRRTDFITVERLCGRRWRLRAGSFKMNLFSAIIICSFSGRYALRFGSEEVTLQKLRERLRAMSDDELIKFGKMVGGDTLSCNSDTGSGYPCLLRA